MEGLDMRSVSGTRIVPAPGGSEAGPEEERMPHSLAAAAVGTLARCLLAAALGVLGGCGGDQAGQPGVETPTGPPSWRALPPEDREGGSGMALRARAPCRVRFRLDGGKGVEQVGAWLALSAGETRLVHWWLDPSAPLVDADAPLPEEEEAGRTEGRAVNLRFRFSSLTMSDNRFLFWSRPGRGSRHLAEALPPGRYEPLAWPTSIELVTIAFADLAAGKAKLLRRPAGNRLRLPDAADPGDHAFIAHLFLDIEPLGGAAD
jgi:hypothetical protein